MILVGSATFYWLKQNKPVAIVAKAFGILNLLLLGTIAFAVITTQFATIYEALYLEVGIGAMYYVLGTNFIKVYTEKQ